jgi:hypothetical protein
MRAGGIACVVFLGVAAAFTAGCSSTPVTGSFPFPLDRVQRAAVDAVVMNGFDVQKEQPTCVEGHRPHKIGLFLGSGGETVTISLRPHEPSGTDVTVETTMSLLGIVGQRSWSADVFDQMRESLEKPEGLWQGNPRQGAGP